MYKREFGTGKLMGAIVDQARGLPVVKIAMGTAPKASFMSRLPRDRPFACGQSWLQ
jgi:hypothetical protein